MNGKGDGRRPRQVSYKTYSDNYDKIFKQENLNINSSGLIPNKISLQNTQQNQTKRNK